MRTCPQKKLSDKTTLIFTLIIITTNICIAAETNPVYAGTDWFADTLASYGIRTGNLKYADITKHDVGVISAIATEVSTTLAYGSYIFTPTDIVLFSYQDGTSMEVYDSAGNPIAFQPNVLDKGEHVYLNTSTGVYFVAGSNKFAVLTGDATTSGVSGYYAMDAQGKGASREFYTYVPTLYGHCEFIVFAYENGTIITVQQEVASGIYADIASFTLDKGKHWANQTLSAKYLHIIADKPVSALTCYDQSYFAPSSNNWWSGKEFYTYLSNIANWPEDLTVIAYYDNTFTSIRDSDTNSLIWEGTLNSGQAYVKSYPSGANKYFTVTSNQPVTVSAQPWVASKVGYVQGTFIPDIYGVGVGTDLIGSTVGDGYLYILAHRDNTHIDLYNSQTKVWQASYTLNAGQFVNANPGNGLWKITSDKEVSAYSGYKYYAQASFAPLIFNKVNYLTLEKVDDVNEGDCVMPGQEINYTLTYNFSGAGDSSVLLIDYLPDEIDYNSSSPMGDYNVVDRTVTWNIGTVLPGANASFTLNGIVNYFAEPCGVITNSCRLLGDSTDLSAEVNTPLCFWTQIIYVDHNATGLNNGLSWDDAYLDLQNALNRAAVDGNSEIWVASGTYKPTLLDPSGYKTFTLVNDIPLYGHFEGNETSLSQRDFNKPNYETILSGVGLSCRNVVTASGLSPKNIIEGFTITGATVQASAGVKIENAYLKCTNCLIKSNGNRGIFLANSNSIISDCIMQNMGGGISSNDSHFTAHNCIIRNNNGGIYEFGSSTGVITGCEIFQQAVHGIELDNSSSAIIQDNWIYRNAEVGINLSTTGTAAIRNNTIFSNRYGINVNSGTFVISNCIVWNNTDDLRYCSATYSCIKNNDSGTGNIHCDPCFVYADGNDFHLRPISLCIDAGDPNFVDFNETDIDADPRITDGDQNGVTVVDIGADEFHFPWADFDKNDIVNFIDFALFAPSWLSADPAKSSDSDNDVDIEDLAIFCEYWLF